MVERINPLPERLPRRRCQAPNKFCGPREPLSRARAAIQERLVTLSHLAGSGLPRRAAQRSHPGGGVLYCLQVNGGSLDNTLSTSGFAHRALLLVPSVVFNVTTRRFLMTTPILSSDKTMPTTSETPDGDSAEELWPGIDSRFRLIVVAALRAKQLVRGARPRIDADPLKRRNTSIALEEVRRGLVPFTISDEG